VALHRSYITRVCQIRSILLILSKFLPYFPVSNPGLFEAEPDLFLLKKMKHRGFLVSNFIAHQNQALCDHLEGVAKFAKSNAEKIGMGKYGELLGLLHDFGKYSAKFQKYIADALKKNDPDFNPDEDEDYEDPAGRLGRIDHSTAGAQYLSIKTGTTNAHKILGQLLSLCLVSHHSGLIECLSTDNNGSGGVD
jgi:hypothetical protein